MLYGYSRRFGSVVGMSVGYMLFGHPHRKRKSTFSTTPVKPLPPSRWSARELKDNARGTAQDDARAFRKHAKKFYKKGDYAQAETCEAHAKLLTLTAEMAKTKGAIAHYTGRHAGIYTVAIEVPPVEVELTEEEKQAIKDWVKGCSNPEVRELLNNKDSLNKIGWEMRLVKAGRKTLEKTQFYEIAIAVL